MKRFTYIKAFFSPFKRPKLKWHFGKIAIGTPYFYPRIWVKNTPRHAHESALNQITEAKIFNKRNKDANFKRKIPSYREAYDRAINSKRAIPKKIGFDFVGLGFKTKWSDTDYRFEWNPLVSFVFFGLQLAVIVTPPEQHHYWEAWLYYENNTDKTKSPIKIGNIQIQEDLVINSGNKKYLILHGDIFDVFITKMGWLAKIGSVMYDFSLWINRWYNRYRKLRNKEYLSIAKKMKESVKFATKFIGNFEEHIADLTKRKSYDGVICGHIHYPIIKKIGEIDYMNSGDWVETMSCLVENYEGEWKIVYYKL